MSLRSEAYALRDELVSRRFSRARFTAARQRAHAALSAYLSDPRAVAYDTVASHVPRLGGQACSCGQVFNGSANGFSRHLVAILGDNDMLKVPPRTSGEGW